MADTTTPDLKRASMCEVVAGSDYSLTIGADEMLQLLNVAAQLQKVAQGA